MSKTGDALAVVDSLLDRVDEHFDAIEKRLDALERALETLEGKATDPLAKLREEADQQASLQRENAKQCRCNEIPLGIMERMRR